MNAWWGVVAAVGQSTGGRHASPFWRNGMHMIPEVICPLWFSPVQTGSSFLILLSNSSTIGVIFSRLPDHI